eukprot:CAMPEP_0194750890 /NCGR_PEP_ID=MMETSP0323_2-20130528/4990_1 /TAXON_ID=2866 ORGANISM="Crypthecodinium cohnii, Strain Seligo" /NCGR_SAMPLE_ID=MMETSP0323_2 /ASSEMBLY_ACC=CAM_ASM_000346 /LENGTH=180 /DNA_ID=CAMNT_0039667021 /DNA_START=604 /DNA_END=1142 /DNA_ORIENTATION=+
MASSPSSSSGERGGLDGSAPCLLPLPGHHALDLLQGLAFGFWHHREDKYQAQNRQGEVSKKDPSRSKCVLKDLLGQSHEDVEPEVHDCSHGQGRSSNAEGKDLGNHEPGNGSEADLIATHINHQSNDGGNRPPLRQPDVVGTAVFQSCVRFVANPEDESSSDQGEGNDHERDADGEQESP